MYKAFSEQKNIEKMVRQVEVFIEQITLEVNLFNWEGNVYGRNYEHWVKYVSTRSGRPKEVYLYWDRKIEDDFQEEIIDDLLFKEGHFERLESYFLDSYKKLEEFTDRLFKKGANFHKKLSNEQLVEYFNQFYEVSKYPLLGYYVVYDCTSLLPKPIKKEIKEKFPFLSQEKIEKKLQVLSTVGITSVVKAEKIEFLKRLKQIRKIFNKTENWGDEKVERIIFEHWYDFGGCSFTHGGDYSTVDYFRNKFKKNADQDPEKELKALAREEAADRKIVEREIEFFKKEKNILKLVSWLRIMMGYRNREAEYWHNYFFRLWPFFSGMAERLNLTLDDFWLLSTDEIIGGLRGKVNAKKIARDRRKKGFTIKQVGDKIKVFTGVKEEDLHEEKVKNRRSFGGTIAYSGKVKGRAKIIFSPFDEIRKFKKGDVLVAPMTTPDYIQLIKKSRAIITDEGGLLCHASIVAREFKKPCIIGTKIATKALKDGNLVEVDAKKGIVKILRRN